MPAKLKVFRTTLGFFEAVVAAPSQTAALRAWDVRENLFQHGAASVEVDPAVVEAALALPGVVLRRPVGGTGAFQAEPELPATPAPKPTAPTTKRGRGGAISSPRPPPPKPDRSALDAAERALSEAQAGFAASREALDAERAALGARVSALEREQATRRRALEQALKAARSAFAKAGGDP